MREIISIVGHTGSGKTTTAQLLSEHLFIPVLTFSAIGNDFAHYHGFGRLRECLSFYLFHSDDKQGFLYDFFDFTVRELLRIKGDYPIIVDGIFSYDVVIFLKQHYRDMIMFHIDVPFDIRVQRISNRLSICSSQAIKENVIKERNKIALGMSEVISLSDYVLDGLKSTQILVDEIVSLL